MKNIKTQIIRGKCLWISNFLTNFNFIGSSVIYLSLSEIPYGLTRGNSGYVCLLRPSSKTVLETVPHLK